MHQIVIFLHLLAGVLWAAGLLLLSAGGSIARLGRLAGPVLLLSGLLLALGSAGHDPGKSLAGLYGLLVLAAVLLFGAAIGAARRQAQADGKQIPWRIVAPVAGLCALMALMAHWPF